MVPKATAEHARSMDGLMRVLITPGIAHRATRKHLAWHTSRTVLCPCCGARANRDRSACDDISHRALAYLLCAMHLLPPERLEPWRRKVLFGDDPTAADGTRRWRPAQGEESDDEELELELDANDLDDLDDGPDAEDGSAGAGSDAYDDPAAQPFAGGRGAGWDNADNDLGNGNGTDDLDDDDDLDYLDDDGDDQSEVDHDMVPGAGDGVDGDSAHAARAAQGAQRAQGIAGSGRKRKRGRAPRAVGATRAKRPRGGGSGDDRDRGDPGPARRPDRTTAAATGDPTVDYGGVTRR